MPVKKRYGKELEASAEVFLQHAFDERVGGILIPDCIDAETSSPEVRDMPAVVGHE